MSHNELAGTLNAPLTGTGNWYQSFEDPVPAFKANNRRMDAPVHVQLLSVQTLLAMDYTLPVIAAKGYFFISVVIF